MNSRFHRLAPLVLCSLVFAAGGDAQTTAAPSGGGGEPKRRAMSESLSGGFRFQPPTPKPVVDKEVDLREIDKPRNEIVRLPKYVVEGVRSPIFRERNLYSAENLRKLAVARYMSGPLNQYQLGKTGEIFAMQMYEDAERLQAIEEGQQHVMLYRASGDDARAKKVQNEVYSSSLRRNDDDTERMSKAMGQRY